MARAHMKSNATDDPSPLGFYNFAVSYHMAADLVAVGGLKATHPESVAMFLYYHAIELYLKSFLRLQGDTAKRLRKIGHDFQTLQSRAKKRGLPFGKVEEEVLAVTAPTRCWSKRKGLPSPNFHPNIFARNTS
jgi:tRNA(Ser,Leu) C12 N-acetylase TAN1